MEKILIKGKFICFEKEFFGLFMIFMDYDIPEEKIIVAAGKSSFISTYSIDANPEKLIEIMQSLLEDEEASLEKSREIRAIFQAQINLIKESLKANLGNLEVTLSEILKKHLESNVEISLNIDCVENFNFVDVEQEKQTKEKSDQEIEKRQLYKIPAEAKIVDCFAVLSPIKGKPITEIKEGDLILAKIDDTSELGKNIAQNYHLYSENKRLKPVIGRVHKRFMENNEILMVLQLAKDLMGLSREDASVKVTYVDAEKIVSKKETINKAERQQEMQEQRKELKIEKIKNESTIYVGLIIFIVVVAIIIFLIL